MEAGFSPGTGVRRIRLLGGNAHECGYLPDRNSQSMFVAPDEPLDNAVYGQLVARGFRRSGRYVYRPDCAGCRACVPVRVAAMKFRPDRAQRRCRRANRDLVVRTVGPAFDTEHFALYRRYLASRHPGGSMTDPSPSDYLNFLTSDWCDSAFMEFRLAGRAVAVAVYDPLPDGLSAVYSFFDPDLRRRGLGVYAVLRLIALTRELGHEWLYLGYWIGASPKMRYKQRYRPQQRLIDERWCDVECEG